MKLKKLNAILGVLSAVALVVHMGYTSYAYLTMYYNPVLKGITCGPFIICACLHGILGMCAVFLLGDGARLDIYKKYNRRIIIQRVSSALIFPLLIIHMKSFELLKETSSAGKWPLFIICILIQICFFTVVVIHTMVSVSKAFITLGLLQDREKQRNLDKIFFIFFAAVLLFAGVVIIRGELQMFLPK